MRVIIFLEIYISEENCIHCRMSVNYLYLLCDKQMQCIQLFLYQLEQNGAISSKEKYVKKITMNSQ